MRVSNGALVKVTQVNVTAPPLANFTIGSGVTIDGGNSLTLASSGSGSLAPDAKLMARNYDLAGNVINIGGGASGLVLTSATLANFAGAASVQLRSGTVINFYDASGLVIGDPAKAIGALTFDAAGLFSEGGATTINAGNVTLTDSQAAPAAGGGLTGSNGILTVNASGAITQGAGSQTLGNFAEVNLNASHAIIFDGAGGLNAGAANVALTAPTVVVNGKATQALTTTGALSILRGPGVAAADAATNIGGALTLTAASIYDSSQIEALAGNVTLAATSGDVTLASGAAIIATGSRIAVLDQVEYAPGGAVKLTAAAGNVTIDSGARVDVSAAGIGYAGSLSIQTPGVATLDGALLGAAAFNDVGGNFSLKAGSLAGALPFSGGFTGSFAATLQHGDITIAAGQTLTSGNVLLVADNGSIYVNGAIDASGPTGGAISLYGKGETTVAAGQPGATGVIIGSTARLYARYQAALAGDPGYANGAASMVQTGGTITLGTSGTADGTYNDSHGYENVAGSGAIYVAAGAIFDVSGGPGGVDINNSGGAVILRAPILASENTNVKFSGTLVTNTDANGQLGKGVALDAYAVWSTTDSTKNTTPPGAPLGAQYFDGIIDPAGWYDSSGTLVAGTFTNASGAIVATWDGANLNSVDGAGSTPSYYLTNDYFAPTTANAGHVAFYQQTLVKFVQTFAATADFSGAQLRVGAAPAIALPTSMQLARPEISLVNPSTAINGGNITVASNWNLGAGQFVTGSNGQSYYQPTYRTSLGEAGVLSLQAANNVAVNATISDGFYETVDAFNGANLVANLIANNPQAAGGFDPNTGLPIFDYNTTGAASLMFVDPGHNNGSFSYDFVAGAAFSVNPNEVIQVAAGNGNGSFTISGHTSYANSLTLALGSDLHTINVPTLLRTGTGSIMIAAAGNVAFLDTVAEGAIYTAGAATTPADFTAPAMSPDYVASPNGLVSTPAWANGGGGVTISAGQSIIGVEPSNAVILSADGLPANGQDWNGWYYHSGASNGTATPFSDCSYLSCQTAAWVNYATFQGIGALGGGNVSLTAGADITGVSASLPETLVVSGGITASDPPAAHFYGGGDLLVRAGGNLNSGEFLVGRGAGLIQAGGAIQADPLNPITQVTGNRPLLLAVQDGFVSAIARGPVTLGAVYDPASLPLEFVSSNTGATEISPGPDLFLLARRLRPRWYERPRPVPLGSRFHHLWSRKRRRPCQHGGRRHGPRPGRHVVLTGYCLLLQPPATSASDARPDRLQRQCHR